jgi:hypothetical protein
MAKKKIIKKKVVVKPKVSAYQVKGHRVIG